ncbi:unnamed protein product [Polarella glacialis]|uniref:Uncharacterized protein n=1 Tax=Polarella glacialis TaxID=89957 RepID=A0A813HSV6_POLGL|nr:unnamed protein product [Polarella glacialis]
MELLEVKTQQSVLDLLSFAKEKKLEFNVQRMVENMAVQLEKVMDTQKVLDEKKTTEIPKDFTLPKYRVKAMPKLEAKKITVKILSVEELQKKMASKDFTFAEPILVKNATSLFASGEWDKVKRHWTASRLMGDEYLERELKLEYWPQDKAKNRMAMVNNMIQMEEPEMIPFSRYVINCFHGSPAKPKLPGQNTEHCEQTVDATTMVSNRSELDQLGIFGEIQNALPHMAKFRRALLEASGDELKAILGKKAEKWMRNHDRESYRFFVFGPSGSGDKLHAENGLFSQLQRSGGSLQELRRDREEVIPLEGQVELTRERRPGKAPNPGTRRSGYTPDGFALDVWIFHFRDLNFRTHNYEVEEFNEDFREYFVMAKVKNELSGVRRGFSEVRIRKELREMTEPAEILLEIARKALRRPGQEALRNLTLIAPSGLHVRGSCSLARLGLQDGDVLVAVTCRVPEVCHADKTFAAVALDGSVLIWGEGSSTDRSYSEVSDKIRRGVQHIFATERAFAALKMDGSVVTWGAAEWGGNSEAVQDRLQSGIQHVYATSSAFAAVSLAGSVVTWGDASHGGNCSQVKEQLQSEVHNLCSTASAFAAVKFDGSVVTWGDAVDGGNCQKVREELQRGVRHISSTKSTFAAVTSDGAVVTWGNARNGGNSSLVQDFLHGGMKQICSTMAAFAALRQDGSVVTWGSAVWGGDSSAAADYLQGDVLHIFASERAFAALKLDGSVVTWGAPEWGGDSEAVQDQLRSGIHHIYSTSSAFAAVSNTGSVVTWGDASHGGNCSQVALKQSVLFYIS